MRFKPGQKVVCTGTGNWFREIPNVLSFLDRLKLLFKGNNAFGPKFNEVVTVDSWPNTDYSYSLPLKEYDIRMDGHRWCYVSRFFEPLVEDATLEAELNSIAEKA